MPDPGPAMSDTDYETVFDGRKDLRDDFLAGNGYDPMSLIPISADCAFRRFFRVRKGGHTAILMESVPDDSALLTPGHKFGDYAVLARALNALDVRVPEIYAVDRDNAYLLVEDFGELTFRRAWDVDAASPRDLYECAVDALVHLHTVSDDIAPILPDYFESHIHYGRRRFVDWFLPALTGESVSQSLIKSFEDMWAQIESGLPEPGKGFVHCDYHLQNLMWLGTEDVSEPRKKSGILDFQGAVQGPQPYDLANLLEDARVEVPPDIRKRMYSRYCEGMQLSGAGREAFDLWYRVLGTQFHCRVAGQFIRLAIRDGKGKYMQYLPLVRDYLTAALDAPALAPFRQWLGDNCIDLKGPYLEDPDSIRPLIRGDAY